MIHVSKRNAQVCYSAVHLFYFTIYAFVHGFGRLYLGTRGFDAGISGVILGMGHLASVVLQPMVASIFERTGVKLNHGISILYGLAALLAVLVLTLPVEGLALALLKEENAELREKLGIDENSVLLCFSTEGDTDKENYKKIVER